MAPYTTGEIAKLCGVSVRTVQYYDNRGLLAPSALSEGGRRLYSEADLGRLKIICFLRELELPIDSIRSLLQEEHPQEVITLLLTRREEELRGEIAQRQQRLETLEEVQRALHKLESFTVESLGDIAHMTGQRARLRRLRGILLAGGILLELLENATLLLGILRGIWWPFVGGLAAVIAGTLALIVFYWKRVAYICPACHRVFVPGFREMLFARHTPSTRRLTCPECGHRGFCVETCPKEDTIC